MIINTFSILFGGTNGFYIALRIAFSITISKIKILKYLFSTIILNLEIF